MEYKKIAYPDRVRWYFENFQPKEEMKGMSLRKVLALQKSYWYRLTLKVDPIDFNYEWWSLLGILSHMGVLFFLVGKNVPDIVLLLCVGALPLWGIFRGYWRGKILFNEQMIEELSEVGYMITLLEYHQVALFAKEEEPRMPQELYILYRDCRHFLLGKTLR